MPSAKTVKLILAAFVLMSLMVMIAVTINTGSTAAKSPIKERILRTRDKTKLPLTPNEMAALKRKAKGQEEDKRTLKTQEFKEMPLKYHAIRNLDSDSWYKDLQIEVKNVGTKPIYFILAYLEFPDHKSRGRDTGLDLTFGELKYVDIAVIADPKDVHLDPGETYVFTIPEENRKWLAKNHENVPQEFKKLDFHIDIISFGDRTGFEIGRQLDLRNIKSI
jgi:hypothetical protein